MPGGYEGEKAEFGVNRTWTASLDCCLVVRVDRNCVTATDHPEIKYTKPAGISRPTCMFWYQAGCDGSFRVPLEPYCMAHGV
eukprot:3940660-Rhodomonas_salina.4